MGRTVLIIDNSDVVQGELGRALMENGYRVVLAANPSQAYQILEHDTPHLIVVDFTANQPTVAKFLGVIRSLRNLQHLPIILLADDARAEQARKLGVSAVILKDQHVADAVVDAAIKILIVADASEVAPRSMLF